METVYTVNEVTLIGKLARDPEIKEITAKFRKANFTVVTSIQSWDKEKGTIYLTKYIFVESSHPLIIKTLSEMKQGDIVYVKGYIDPQEWTNNQGIKQYKTAIVCTMLVNGGGMVSENGSMMTPVAGSSQPTAAQNLATASAEDDRFAKPAPIEDVVADDDEDVPF